MSSTEAVDWVSGSLYLRPIAMQRGQAIAGHSHNFDHTHITQAGWILVRGWVAGREVVVQKCSEEYRRLRALLLKYEPESVLRPIRFPDRQTPQGALFDVQFIPQGEPVPDGGTEIDFNPSGYHVLIHAGVLHDMVALDDGHGDCCYSHREPQGTISLTRTGWDEGYV